MLLPAMRYLTQQPAETPVSDPSIFTRARARGVLLSKPGSLKITPVACLASPDVIRVQVQEDRLRVE
jgi:hypothetical protein